MSAAEAQILFNQFLGIVDHTGHADGIGAQIGPDQQGLGIRVGNTADGGRAPHFLENMLKLGPERRIADIVNLPLQADLLVPRGHTGPAGTQMAVVVHAEKHIQHTVLFGRNPEKSTHVRYSCVIIVENREIRRRKARSGSWDQCTCRPCKPACCRWRFHRSASPCRPHHSRIQI